MADSDSETVAGKTSPCAGEGSICRLPRIIDVNLSLSLTLSVRVGRVPLEPAGLAVRKAGAAGFLDTFRRAARRPTGGGFELKIGVFCQALMLSNSVWTLGDEGFESEIEIGADGAAFWVIGFYDDTFLGLGSSSS